jgi:hypothetical protein
VDNGNKYEQNSACHEEGYEPFLEMIEDFHHASDLREKKGRFARAPRP